MNHLLMHNGLSIVDGTVPSVVAVVVQQCLSVVDVFLLFVVVCCCLLLLCYVMLCIVTVQSINK